MISVEVTRSNTLRTVMNAVRSRIEVRIPQALIATAATLYDRSQELVPRDTEALADSGQILHYGGTGFSTVIIVGYGMDPGFQRYEFSPHEQKVVLRRPWEYAVYVHEDVSKIHPTGQAHYLEGAISLPELSRVLHEAMRG